MQKLKKTARSFYTKKNEARPYKILAARNYPAPNFFMRKKPTTYLHGLVNLTKKTAGAIVELYNQMIRRLTLVSLWLLITPTLVILISILLAAPKSYAAHTTITAPLQASVADTSVPNNIQGQVISTEITDTRPYIVERFLKGTPLAKYSAFMVETADKYEIDYRFIPAIAMKESGGGSAAPMGTFNAWGFENGRTQFTSWESAIDRVGKTLKDRYVAKGLTTPDEIMPIYAPPAIANGGGWARDINFFFIKMESL